MFEDECEEALLKLRQLRERLDQRNPDDDREKLLRDKIMLIEMLGLEVLEDEERPELAYRTYLPY